MILYFTGTGNSRNVAEELSHELGDEAVSLNEVLRSERDASFASDKPFAIVAPIHTWNYPEPVAHLLVRSSCIGTRKAYFVATMSGISGVPPKAAGR